MKAAKASKEEIMAAVDELKKLKAKHLEVHGSEFAPTGTVQGSRKDKKKAAPEKPAPKAPKAPKAQKAPKAAKPPPAPAAGNALAELNGQVEYAPYLGGYAPSAADAAAFAKHRGAACDAAQLPHAARWLAHMASFDDAARAAWK